MDLLLTHGFFLDEDEKEQQIMKPYAPLGFCICLRICGRAGLMSRSTIRLLDRGKSCTGFCRRSRPRFSGSTRI